jgi:hypothetical protein
VAELGAEPNLSRYLYATHDGLSCQNIAEMSVLQRLL